MILQSNASWIRENEAQNLVSLMPILLLQNSFFTIKVYIIVIIMYHILYNRIKLNNLTLITLVSLMPILLLQNSFFTIEVYTVVINIYYILYIRIKLNNLTLIKLEI